VVSAFHKGDSGGPVYTTLSNGTVEARGMVVAYAGSDYTTGFYTKVANIDSAMGVKVTLCGC
jgi:hypothetical protein